jgi:hypothetical protein
MKDFSSEKEGQIDFLQIRNAEPLHLIPEASGQKASYASHVLGSIFTISLA